MFCAVLGAGLVYYTSSKTYTAHDGGPTRLASSKPGAQSYVVRTKRTMKSTDQCLVDISEIFEDPTIEISRVMHVREEGPRDKETCNLVNNGRLCVGHSHGDDQAAPDVAERADNDLVEIFSPSPFKSTKPRLRSFSSAAYQFLNTGEPSHIQRVSRKSNTSPESDDDAISFSSSSVPHNTSPRTPPDQSNLPLFNVCPLDCSKAFPAKTKQTSGEWLDSEVKPMTVPKGKTRTKTGQRRLLSEPIPLQFDNTRIKLDIPESEVFKSIDRIPRESSPNPPHPLTPHPIFNTLEYAATMSICGDTTLRDYRYNEDFKATGTKDGKALVVGEVEDPFTEVVGNGGRGHDGGRKRKLKQAWRDQPTRLSL